MNKVFQTIDTPEYGNCLEACLASILEDNIENFPRIDSGSKWPNWITPINNYLIEIHRCYLLCLDSNNPRKDFFGHYIIVGDNKNSTHSHAMIGHAGKVFFDPSGRKCKFETFKYLLLVRYV